ncbi:MAG: hypothetical protein EOP83_23295 [Verrucomicrobiaceae bacterium]|nr:MAG: hypothetical protein EOP83_23295 [Verrucomicrobiaceae bacterium]
MGKREIAITKAHDLIDAWSACLASGKTPGTKAVVDIMAEDLIDYLLQNFDGPLNTAQILEVFTGNNQWLVIDAIRDLPDPMVPIAIVRELLGRHKIMFNPMNVTNWTTFVQKFGKYILAA